ncbi:MAG: YdjY domain-containing protein [Planctomycetota bacterium]
MRTATLALLLVGFLGRGHAQEPKPAEEPAPVDVAKVLRESPEFKETCKRFRISWEEGVVRATGEIAYRGGGPCEYIVNVSPAKAHETIVLLDTGPWTSKRRPSGARLNGYATCLNNALLCAGFKPGKPFGWNEQTGEMFPPQGEVVHLYFEWKDEAKAEIRARVPDLLWNYRTVDVMQRETLVYTGSMMIDEGPPKHQQWFGAEVDRLIVACYSTPTSLIDNTEEGAAENGTYEAIHARVPDVGTRVTVVFSRKPLEGVTEFKPLELPEEVLAERKRRAEEKAKPPAPPAEGEGK